MKKILIIENNSDLLNRYSSTLQNAGYEVITSLNSDVGINLAINIKPHLVLCNPQLDDMDGFEVLSKLTKNPLTTQIPIIFIKPTSTSDEIKYGIQYGADDFITNPFQSNQLIRSVEARINRDNDHNSVQLPLNKLHTNSLPTVKSLERLHELIAQSKVRHLKKKQTLYFEGDYSQWLYYLVEGSIKTLKLTNDGRELIMGLYKPKSFIGLDSLLLDEAFNHTAEATMNSSLYFISKSAVLELMNEHVELNQHFLRILSTTIHEKEDKLVELAYESVKKRLAKALIRLVRDSVPIDIIDISRDELAGLAGVATETVSRILTDFKEKGLIERNGSQIQILDLEGLMDIKN